MTRPAQPPLAPARASQAATAAELAWALAIAGGVHQHRVNNVPPFRWTTTSSTTALCGTPRCARIPIVATPPRNGAKP